MFQLIIRAVPKNLVFLYRRENSIIYPAYILDFEVELLTNSIT
jgi:hypothetical protein